MRGKLFRKSMETNVQSVAKLRLADFTKGRPEGRRGLHHPLPPATGWRVNWHWQPDAFHVHQAMVGNKLFTNSLERLIANVRRDSLRPR